MRPAFPAALAAALLAGTAFAQIPNSAPQPVTVTDTIPAARDIDYPGGPLTLAVDATDTARGIFRVKESIPVAAPGPLVLLFPKWLPGKHSPVGEIDKLAGLTITANGQPVRWVRDPVDVYAFHVDVPQGARALDLSFQFVSATASNQGRIVTTPNIVNLQWVSLALYPAGYYARRIMVDASATYPAGWKAASALRAVGAPAGTATGQTIRYGRVPYDVLLDSPVFAGRYTRTEQLAPDVTLNMVADDPQDLAAATPAQIALHRTMVDQARKLYGSSHFDHYDFLWALSDELGGIGLEHHRSSENSSTPKYFTDWANLADARDLLPHEFTHSWNGKFRRPADLWTPDYRTPMQDSLLWVYEGQTQFWGEVLATRSGLWSKDDMLGSLAAIAASYTIQPGRHWRPLIDTTNEPIISQRRAEPWRNWQRPEDYYAEGQLIWLDVDSLIRTRTRGARSLDDFARAFFGVRDRDYGELTYAFDDIVKALNDVMPYDWATYLSERVNDVRPVPPLDWLARSGYRLTFTDTPTDWFKNAEKARKYTDLINSLGMNLSDKGDVIAVLWDGPAFQSGLVVGSSIVAVDGTAYDADGLRRAIRAAAGGTQPIHLLVKSGDRYRDVAIAWNGGLRYPRLERTGSGPSALDALLMPRK